MRGKECLGDRKPFRGILQVDAMRTNADRAEELLSRINRRLSLQLEGDAEIMEDLYGIYPSLEDTAFKAPRSSLFTHRMDEAPRLRRSFQFQGARPPVKLWESFTPQDRREDEHKGQDIARESANPFVCRSGYVALNVELSHDTESPLDR